ncbi:MAG TPA: BtrH N-terminal domain-containing protein [Anaerolineales bacterium]|nr:BtrH N-terminal domain-containing protein [Anaerolineales bacterium]
MMTTLPNYNEFQGHHWETGTVRNFYAYRGVRAPHTNEPYTEALLMGISGGAVMGYFTFAYEGYDPLCRILTRNTFDPLETMLTRLGVVQHLQHTANPDKGRANLLDTLASGIPVIVWADHYTLPYNAQPLDAGMWAMFPILVYGYDEAADTVWIADRASVPLTVTPAELQAARSRVKKDKFRTLTLDPPNPDKLVSAVQAGIWDCIKLYTEAPPKGSKNNFGLQAYNYWAELLTKPRARLSWERQFPAGRKMFSALNEIYDAIHFFNGYPSAERGLFADFLDEASVILHRPALKEAATHFRTAARAWDDLGLALLPDDIAPFKEARELMHRRAHLFRSQGIAAIEEIRQLSARQSALKTQMETDFPLAPDEVVTFRENLAAYVIRVHDVEKVAVTALRDAMA